MYQTRNEEGIRSKTKTLSKIWR